MLCQLALIVTRRLLTASPRKDHLPLSIASQLRPSAIIVHRTNYLSWPEKPQPPLFIAIVVVLINKVHIAIINNNNNDHILNKNKINNNSRNNSNNWICIPLPFRGSRKGYSQIVVEVIRSDKKTWNISYFNWLGRKQDCYYSPCIFENNRLKSK